MAKIVVDNKRRDENIDFVVYNYFATQERITAKETKDDLRERYDIILTEEEVEKIFKDYVKRGILTPMHRYYLFTYY